MKRYVWEGQRLILLESRLPKPEAGTGWLNLRLSELKETFRKIEMEAAEFSNLPLKSLPFSMCQLFETTGSRKSMKRSTLSAGPG